MLKDYKSGKINSDDLWKITENYSYDGNNDVIAEIRSVLPSLVTYETARDKDVTTLLDIASLVNQDDAFLVIACVGNRSQVRYAIDQYILYRTEDIDSGDIQIEDILILFLTEAEKCGKEQLDIVTSVVIQMTPNGLLAYYVVVYGDEFRDYSIAVAHSLMKVSDYNTEIATLRSIWGGDDVGENRLKHLFYGEV